MHHREEMIQHEFACLDKPHGVMEEPRQGLIFREPELLLAFPPTPTNVKMAPRLASATGGVEVEPVHHTSHGRVDLAMNAVSVKAFHKPDGLVRRPDPDHHAVPISWPSFLGGREHPRDIDSSVELDVSTVGGCASPEAKWPLLGDCEMPLLRTTTNFYLRDDRIQD